MNLLRPVAVNALLAFTDLSAPQEPFSVCTELECCEILDFIDLQRPFPNAGLRPWTDPGKPLELDDLWPLLLSWLPQSEATLRLGLQVLASFGEDFSDFWAHSVDFSTRSLVNWDRKVLAWQCQPGLVMLARAERGLDREQLLLLRGLAVRLSGLWVPDIQERGNGSGPAPAESAIPWYLEHPVDVLKELYGWSIPVLLSGATGVGKTRSAKILHENSASRGGAFIELNCAAIPEDLLESTLFGQERGAYTGAEKKEGVFKQADGGTLFLDEIGEMSLAHQAKILKVLDRRPVSGTSAKAMLTRSLTPIGGQEITVKVRLLFGTNRDLKAEVEKGRFREDLYYRIRIYQVTIPPFRAWPEEQKSLAIQNLMKEYWLVGGPVPSIDEKASQWLYHQRFPGNFRELTSVLIRGMMRLHREGGDCLKKEQLQCGEILDVVETEKPVTPGLSGSIDGIPVSLTETELLRWLVMDPHPAAAPILRQRLQHQTRVQIAKEIGIDDTTFGRKLKKLLSEESGK